MTLLERAQGLEHVLDRLNRNAPLSSTDRHEIERSIALLRGEERLSTGDVKARLGLGSINTVKRLVDEGYLDGVKDEHGNTWITLASVVALEVDRGSAARLSRSRTKGIRASRTPSHRLSLGD